MVFLLLLFGGFLWACVAVWAAVDAHTNSPHDPVLWGLTVFFGGFVGLLLYLNLGRVDRSRPGATRDSPPELVECPHCHAQEVAARDRCRFCEQPLDAP